MVLGEEREQRLNQQDYKVLGLVDELKYLLLDGAPLATFENNLAVAYQSNRRLLTPLLRVMVRNGMSENDLIIKAVSAATKLDLENYKGE